MKSDYEVLGLNAGADEKEIKRAYFKLIRKFSPEKDPERFQQIREAYENLIKGKGQVQLALHIPEDSFAQKMFQQIERLYRQQDYQYALETAEEAIRYYGECEGFLYYLALLQRKRYYTGKAVKSFEKLVKLDPENMVFARELAISYLERGYGKKAYEAFGRAYDMGCRDIDFLDSYAHNCEDREDYGRAIELLLELVEAGKADLKEYIMYLLDGFGGLFLMCHMCGGEQITEIKESFMKFLKDAVPYMSEYPEELFTLLGMVVYTLKSMNQWDTVIEEEMRSQLKKGLGQEQTEELWNSMGAGMEYVNLLADSRLSDIVKAAYEGFMPEEFDEAADSHTVQRFALLDCKLCILEEWPAIKAEFEIVRKCYPRYYEAVREFLELLEKTKNINYLREKLLKDFERLGKYVSGSYYEERYAERYSRPKIIAEPDWGDDPYVRMQPKIGRNDPCPCGSGKKYKKCCGKAV